MKSLTTRLDRKGNTRVRCKIIHIFIIGCINIEQKNWNANGWVILLDESMKDADGGSTRVVSSRYCEARENPLNKVDSCHQRQRVASNIVAWCALNEAYLYPAVGFGLSTIANDGDEFPVGKLEGLCYLCIRPLDGEMFP